MGLAWQQGPLPTAAAGRFLVPDPHTELPGYASGQKGRAAFAWRAMDAFYEEDERIAGHAAGSYHRIDIRQTIRHLVVRSCDRVAADSRRPLVLYEPGFAPRWYVPRGDIDESVLTRVQGQTTTRCTRSCTPGCDGRVPLPARAGKLSEGQDC